MRSGVERVGPGPPAETATAELDGFDSRERPRGFPKELHDRGGPVPSLGAARGEAKSLPR